MYVGLYHLPEVALYSSTAPFETIIDTTHGGIVYSLPNAL